MIRYNETHEYIRQEGEFGFIGVSDYAQKQLGNVVYVDMPEIGEEIEAGEEFGAIESVKAASDLIAPVSGEIVEINEDLENNPRLINEDAMSNWIVKIRLSDSSQLDGLMDEDAYRTFCKK